MTSADPPLRSGEAADEPEIDDTDDVLPEDEEEFDSDETGATDDNLAPMTLALTHRAFLVNPAAA